MEDIEVVIKIPEEVYKNIQSKKFWLDSGLTLSNAYDFIRNGIPLPKEHGDLIDISKLPVTYAYLGISDKPTDVVNYNCILSAKKIIRGR